MNSGLIGGAKLPETIFGLEHKPRVLITLVAVSSYTFIGGFMAVSRTDVFQAMVMLVSFIILPLTLIFATAEPFTGTGQSPGPGGMFDMEIATAPGFIAATAAAIVVTLLTSPPSAEVTERFDRGTAAA